MAASVQRTAFALAAPRPEGPLGIELEWFWNQAECDMGVPSNFFAVFFSTHTEEDHWSAEDAAEAAHAHRRIRRWLLSVPTSDAAVLQTAYVNRPWPPRLRSEMGRVTGVVVRLACARDVWPLDRAGLEVVENWRAGWLEKQCGATCRWSFSPLVKLRREAEARLTRALRAYARVRGPRPCVVRLPKDEHGPNRTAKNEGEPHGAP